MTCSSSGLNSVEREREMYHPNKGNWPKKNKNYILGNHSARHEKEIQVKY